MGILSTGGRTCCDILAYLPPIRGTPASPDAELRLAERVLVDDLHPAHAREPRAPLAPGHERGNRLGGTFEHRFDATVGQVAHQPADAERTSLRGARRPESHALHAAFDDDTLANVVHW